MYAHYFIFEILSNLNTQAVTERIQFEYIAIKMSADCGNRRGWAVCAHFYEDRNENNFKSDLFYAALTSTYVTSEL